MINPNYKILSEYFSEKRRIVITTHRSPDGDALGSSVAIYEAFKNQGHEICIIVPNSFPDYLNFIPNSNEVIIFDQDENKAIYEITRLISKRIEEWIIDKPEQWLWAHRRWGK